MKLDLKLACIAFLFLFALSLTVIILTDVGPAESAHDPTCIWLYIRRLLLAGFAALLPLAASQKGLSNYGWKISPRWLLIAVLIGVFMGSSNPGGFGPMEGFPVLVVLAVAAVHTFATELFFRAYLITTLSNTFKKFWPPVLISSAMYGLFYLSVWNVWSRPLSQKIAMVLLFTFVGLVYGICYKKSKSFLVPWIAHMLGVIKYGEFF